MNNLNKISNVSNDENGATLVEFAIIAVPFIGLLMGIMEVGYQGYVDTMSKSVMHQVARQSSVGGKSKEDIENEVKNALAPVLLDNAEVRVNVASYFDFTNIGRPEKITKDQNEDGNLDSGDCYLDGNANGEFDIDTGVTGTGGPDDIVTYEISIDAPRIFPFASIFGIDEKMRINNVTAVRNQPFGAQVNDTELCEE